MTGHRNITLDPADRPQNGGAGHRRAGIPTAVVRLLAAGFMLTLVGSTLPIATRADDPPGWSMRADDAPERRARGQRAVQSWTQRIATTNRA